MTSRGTTRGDRLLTTVGRVTTTPLLLRRLTTAQWQLIDAGLAVIVTFLCWYAAVEPTSPTDDGWGYGSSLAWSSSAG